MGVEAFMSDLCTGPLLPSLGKVNLEVKQNLLFHCSQARQKRMPQRNGFHLSG